MKILYWTPLFWPDTGGIEMLAMNTLPALLDQGYQFIVVASHGHVKQPDITEYEGIPVYRFPFWTALANRDLGLMINIRKEITALKQVFKADLVHIHFSGYTVYFQLATANVHPVPTLVTLHSSLADCNAEPDTLLERLLRTADWITTVSQATLTDAREVFPEISKRSSVIYGCAALPSMAPLPLPFEKPRILCIGRLVREKGFDLVVDAVGKLVNRYSQLSLTIVGDGPERNLLERQVDTLGLTDIVEFTGMVQNNTIPQLLNTATIIAIPSRYREPFGLVALEAAQMARPIVASRIGGIPESVVHQQTGLLVDNEDSKAIANAIAFLLDHPEKARQMGEAGKKQAFEKFGIEGHVDAYDTLYRDVFNRYRNRQTVYQDMQNESS